MNIKAIEIQYKLKLKGIKQIDIARKFEVSNELVSLIVNMKKRSQKIEKYIEDITREKFFPERKKRCRKKKIGG